MSTPAPLRSTGALQAAQQQLDELDALIQRMLTLPTNPTEEPLPPEASAPMPTPASSLPASAELGFMAEEPRPLADSPPIPAAMKRSDSRRKSAALSPPEPAVELLPPPLLDPLEVEFRPVPLASDLPFDGEDEVLPPAEPFRSEPGKLQSDDADDEYIEEEPLPPREEFSYPAERRGPLVRTNQAFDRLTYPLGSAGYWLRSPVGRDVLGWVGVLLITGSVAWAVLDWLGWTW